MDRIEWKCPECGASFDSHGRGGAEECRSSYSVCDGFSCDCDNPEEGGEEHGESYAYPCSNAVCAHCDWSGVFPPPPQKALAWEKKALAAGWQPPAGWKAGAK